MTRHLWKPSIAATLFASLFLTGCNGQSASRQPPAPEVAVVTVEPRQVVLTTELPGRTSSYLIAEIRPQVNGLLQKRLFTEGSDVKAGQPLYQIDPAPYQAALENATANLLAAKKAADRARAALVASEASLGRHESILKLAKINFGRYQKLAETDAASKMQRDEAESAVAVANSGLKVAKAQVESDRQAIQAAEASIQQAEAALKTAQINLDYTKISAPISGRIGRSHVTEGAIVTAYQSVPLATIQQLDPIYADVPQSTAELNRLRRSLANGSLTGHGTDQVTIIQEDGTVYPLAGSLKFRDVTVDPTTGSVILRIVVPNPERILLPGMFVRVIVEEGVRDEAMLIPQQAVSRDSKGEPLVHIVDAEGKVEQRGLVTDRALGDQWLVSAGLAQGDRVIVEGTQKARPGMVVKPIPFDANRINAIKPAAHTARTGAAQTQTTSD